MALKNFYKKYENCILAFAWLLPLLLFVGIRYDYYYDLNDDVTIKDLMAGVYTGEPEGHNIQVLYPLSLAISLIYRVFPETPVYGIFLCLCQYGCLWLVVKRSLGFCRRTGMKICLAGAAWLMAAGLLLEHLVFVQYTVVSALLSATAAFLFITSEKAEAGRFIRGNIPAILLAVLSFQLRTEMMELLFPFICTAGLYRWCTEEKILIKENYKKYFTILSMILAGAGISWAVNRAAFSGIWKPYVDFFNSRTELYDFQGIPPYEGNEGFYEKLGMAQSEQYMLLEQYNFGLDDTLDAEALDAVAEYQDGIRKDSVRFGDTIKESIKSYRYRILHREPPDSGREDDYPWNYMMILGYGAVFLAGIRKSVGKRKQAAGFLGKTIACLIVLFAVRTALWMFILVRGRAPVRITHSLYLMELCILMAMLLMECAEMGMAGRTKKAEGAISGIMGNPYPILFAVALSLTAGLALPGKMAGADKESENRTAANRVYEGMKEYGKAHSGCFYFQDVYSAVSYPSEPYAGTFYSEKMFAGVDNGLANYDIMGGWLVKSPSQKKKLEHFGITSMSEGLLYQENVYWMAELEKGTDAILAYFREQGVEARIELTDEICGIIGVYRIEAEQRGESENE